MALGLISVEFPEFVGTTVKIPDHAWFFRFGIRGGIAMARQDYIYIRQVIEISTIVRKHAQIGNIAGLSPSLGGRLMKGVWLVFTSGMSLPPDPVAE
jgi:hypothetical protein